MTMPKIYRYAQHKAAQLGAEMSAKGVQVMLESRS